MKNKKVINIDNLDSIGKLEGLYNWCKQPQNKLLHKKFDMSKWNDYSRIDLYNLEADLKREVNGKSIPQCGTSGCIAGELPAISNLWRFKGGSLVYRPHIDKDKTTFESLSDYFLIPHSYICQIFSPAQAFEDKKYTKSYYLKRLKKYIDFLKEKQEKQQ